MAKKQTKHSKLWSTDGVPQWVDREAEGTIPQAAASSDGPSHAQLRALAAGNSPALPLTDRYRVERRIGNGGMATVYAGRLLSLDRPVAIKILDEVIGPDKENRYARFVAEVHMNSSFRHRNIVDVLDFGSTQDGVLFMVMELLEGEDLKTLVRRSGPLPWPQTHAIMQDICAGLVAVHRAGLVHRDLKPANCFLTLDSTKLLDFGIATHANTSRSGPPADPRRARDSTEERMTEDGAVLGTPEYMSPEQAQGRAVDGRSDIYTAGLLLGELLTGRLPFEGGRATLVITDQIHKTAPSMTELASDDVNIDPAVVAIYARALRKRPDERFATIEAFGAALASVTVPGPVTVSPPAWSRRWQTGPVFDPRSTVGDMDRRNAHQPNMSSRSPRARTRPT